MIVSEGTAYEESYLGTPHVGPLLHGFTHGHCGWWQILFLRCVNSKVGGLLRHLI